MNILVTGGEGFIGSSIRKHLGKKFTFFSLAKNNSLISSYNFCVDLTDIEESKKIFSKILREVNIDVIIHCASVLVTPDNLNSTKSLIDNLKITESVVEGVKILNPAKLIHLSSIAVYPNENGIFSEESKVQTSNNTECMYGLSKICAENLFDFLLRDHKIQISHLRLAQVYGDGMRKDRIYQIMVDELKLFNRITVFGEGERVSNFIHISELIWIIEKFLLKNLGGVFNIGSENLSYLQLAEQILEKFGNNSSYILKKLSGSRAKFILDTTKFKNS